MWLFFMISTFNLTILTIERYIKLVHPLASIKKTQPWMIKLALALPYIIGFLNASLQNGMSIKFVNGVCLVHKWPSVTAGKAFGSCNYFVKFFIPMSIMIFCYVKIFLKIRNRSKSIVKIKEGDSSSNFESSKSSKYILFLKV